MRSSLLRPLLEEVVAVAVVALEAVVAVAEAVAVEAAVALVAAVAVLLEVAVAPLVEALAAQQRAELLLVRLTATFQVG